MVPLRLKNNISLSIFFMKSVFFVYAPPKSYNFPVFFVVLVEEYKHTPLTDSVNTGGGTVSDRHSTCIHCKAVIFGDDVDILLNHCVQCPARTSEDKCTRCYRCSYAASNKYFLIDHIVAKHKGGENRFKCARCPESFVNKTRLLKHVRTHNTAYLRPFRCSHCGYRASTNSAVTTHMLSKHSDCWMFE